METLNVNTIDYIITEDSLCISSDTYDFLKSENLVPGTIWITAKNKIFFIFRKYF